MIKTRYNTFSLKEPIVMGILNLTPDSFFDGNRYLKSTSYLHQVEKMLIEGADIIDIGAVSSRPGASLLSVQEEIERLEKPIQEVLKHFPKTSISIDTFRQSVVERFWDEGISIVNDISGGTLDNKMISFVDKNHIPYVMMHMQGTPQNMQQNPHYLNITNEIKKFFQTQLQQFTDPRNVILDVGFGFGKTLAHNYQLLKELSSFQELGLPILVGISRKSMIYKLLNIIPEEALNGTTVAHTIALLNGVNILRVHDVKEAKEAVKIIQFMDL